MLDEPAGYGVQFPAFDMTDWVNWSAPNMEPLGGFPISSPASNAGSQTVDGKLEFTWRFTDQLTQLTHVISRSTDPSAEALEWAFLLSTEKLQRFQ
jgi:hypothetical protein